MHLSSKLLAYDLFCVRKGYADESHSTNPCYCNGNELLLGGTLQCSLRNDFLEEPLIVEFENLVKDKLLARHVTYLCQDFLSNRMSCSILRACIFSSRCLVLHLLRRTPSSG